MVGEVIWFNKDWFPHERCGRSVDRFEIFINNNELIDLYLAGRKFIWSNNQKILAMSRSTQMEIEQGQFSWCLPHNYLTIAQ